MNSQDYTFTRVNWLDAQADLSGIRADVFMLEQQVSEADEWDGKDEHATHFLVRAPEGTAVATARILIESGSAGEARYHIGRVAVRQPWRGQGIGHRLMQTAMGWCLNRNAHAAIYLHAQTNRQGFYTRLGFVAEGTEFMDAGIAHIAMWYRCARDNG